MVHLSLEGSENVDNGARRILLRCQRKAPLHVGAYIINHHAESSHNRYVGAQTISYEIYILHVCVHT